MTELCEYAGNVDVPIARESIRAVGKIALQQYDVNAIVDRLLQFLEMEKDYVTAETLVSMSIDIKFLYVCKFADFADDFERLMILIHAIKSSTRFL